MLRCNEPAPPIVLFALYDPTQISGCGTGPARKENLDTHSHHSSSLTNSRDLAFYFSGKRASKSDFVLFFSVTCLLARGLAAYFLGVKRSGRERGCLAQFGPLVPYLLTSYHYKQFALWLRRYPGTCLYIYFWEGGILVWPLVSGLGRECAELCWIVSVWGYPPFIICAVFGS